MSADPYIGRFAPSPSGPLHFGSLVAALASYLDARAYGGQWLVRMEDIDPPREQPGAAAQILRCLEAHQLHWDGEVLYQSSRQQAYRDILHHLQQQGLCYPCCCTRQRLKSLQGRYDQHCLQHPPPQGQPAALRLVVEARHACQSFQDIFQGFQEEDLGELGDFVIHRKDGLFAYQLAVVVDDWYQGVSHVIRGSDLLDTTARQRYLFQQLGVTAPHYGHIPVALHSNGLKLSKQNHAPPLDSSRAAANLRAALVFLGHPPPGELACCAELLQWGLDHWQRQAVAPRLSQQTPASGP